MLETIAQPSIAPALKRRRLPVGFVGSAVALPEDRAHHSKTGVTTFTGTADPQISEQAQVEPPAMLCDTYQPQNGLLPLAHQQFEQSSYPATNTQTNSVSDPDAMQVEPAEPSSECPCGHLHGPGQGHHEDVSAFGLSSQPLLRGPE